MSEVNLGGLSLKLWSACPDGACETVEEKENVNHGASSSHAYSLCNNNKFDLKEGLSVPDKKDEEQKNHENTNGASSSTSPRFDFDLNEFPPPDSEREDQPQQNPSCFSISLVHQENPPNPNPQTSVSSEKRPLAQKRRSSGELKKPKKHKPEPEAVSEVVSLPNWLDQVMKTMEETKAPHRITCEDAKLIFEKELSESDVNRGQSRFLIPFNQLKRNDFLTQVESSFIEQEKDEKGKRPGIKAILVNEKAENWSLLLKLYEMKKNKNYALNRGWNNIVKGNGLKENDKISLWSFRFEEVLHFALGTD